jgi:selenide,water dikinase
MALVLTLDFFPAIVDDPYTFGQIAAANALSDVYAMGGRPITALNIVGFPEGKLPLEALGEMLHGGADKVNEAGAVVVGGHTIRDTEVKYGLSVAGLVDPRRILRKEGASNGDLLILTKPLGTGIYSTALKNEALGPMRERHFYAVMSALNRAAAETFVEFNAHACTDITGFGLLGHALEMAQQSDVSLRIDAAALPLLPDVADLAERGFLTGGGMSNREYVREHLAIEGTLSSVLEMILVDPQTSGGLLAALSPADARRSMAALGKRGVADAVIIGEVTAPSEKRLVVIAR